MPGLLLWGLLTIVLEFVPYLGAAAMIVMLSISALATFDNLLHAALVPAAYLLITTIQNNLVSPILYGNHLRLNPTAVLVGVIAWWYVWGIPGAFIAVPMIAAVKIVADHSERLRAVSEFLGE
jgi:predicted PurR-regulated permease PerM